MKKMLMRCFLPLPVKIVILFLVITSCENENKHGLIIEKNNKAILGSKYSIKLYYSDSETEILRAYFDCLDKGRAIDQKTARVNGCKKQLYVENDTIYVELTPHVLGKKTFPNITVLYRRKDNIYSIMDTTFSYIVIKSPSGAGL